MRLEMLNPPYTGEDAERVARWVPPNVDVEPLNTVRTMLLNHPEMGERMRPFAWFFLDPDLSTLEIRVREVAVARTCAKANCEYQWGVHQVVFGDAAGFTDEQRISSVWGSADDPVWDDRDRAIIHAVDELLATNTLTDGTWDGLLKHLNRGQALELVALIGWYLLNCFTTNATQTPLEGFAARFPAALVTS